MNYFNSRDIAAISLSASLWAVINWLVAPLVWRLTHIPILCDMIGVSSLILVAWWVRKPGSSTFLGVLATILNFVLRPDSPHFIGFTAACIFFDVVLTVLGYGKTVEGGIRSSLILVATSIVATGIAGYIIGFFFMDPIVLQVVFGGAFIFIAVHGAGGLIGGVLGVVIIRELERRQVIPRAGRSR